MKKKTFSHKIIFTNERVLMSACDIMALKSRVCNYNGRGSGFHAQRANLVHMLDRDESIWSELKPQYNIVYYRIIPIYML